MGGWTGVNKDRIRWGGVIEQEGTPTGNADVLTVAESPTFADGCGVTVTLNTLYIAMGTTTEFTVGNSCETTIFSPMRLRNIQAYITFSDTAGGAVGYRLNHVDNYVLDVQEAVTGVISQECNILIPAGSTFCYHIQAVNEVDTLYVQWVFSR